MSMSMSREEILSDAIDELENGTDRIEAFEADPDSAAILGTLRKIRASRAFEAPSADFNVRGWERIAQATQENRTLAKRRFQRKRLWWITTVATLLLVMGLAVTPFLGQSDVSASSISVIADSRLANLGPSQASLPRYAGSDQVIGYGAADDTILLWNRESGLSTKLPLTFAYSRDATWSPDGKRMAFAGYEKAAPGPSSPGIWTVDGNGAEPKPVVLPQDADMAFEGPVWSPAGDRIAFTAVRAQLSDANGVIYERSLAVVNADGSDYRTLVKGSQPTWSPDGKKLAYTVGEGTESPQIWIVDLSDGTQRKLADGQMPAWSPIGSFIAYAKTRAESRVFERDGEGAAAYSADIRYQELWATHIDSGVETQLTHSAYPERQLKQILAETKGRGDSQAAYAVSGETADGQPAWSPDGKHLVFTRDVNEESGVHFCLQELTIDYR